MSQLDALESLLQTVQRNRSEPRTQSSSAATAPSVLAAPAAPRPVAAPAASAGASRPASLQEAIQEQVDSAPRAPAPAPAPASRAPAPAPASRAPAPAPAPMARPVAAAGGPARVHSLEPAPGGAVAAVISPHPAEDDASFGELLQRSLALRPR